MIPATTLRMLMMLLLKRRRSCWVRCAGYLDAAIESTGKRKPLLPQRSKPTGLGAVLEITANYEMQLRNIKHALG
jgi:hypothetical protein